MEKVLVGTRSPAPVGHNSNRQRPLPHATNYGEHHGQGPHNAHLRRGQKKGIPKTQLYHTREYVIFEPTNYRTPPPIKRVYHTSASSSSLSPEHDEIYLCTGTRPHQLPPAETDQAHSLRSPRTQRHRSYSTESGLQVQDLSDT